MTYPEVSARLKEGHEAISNGDLKGAAQIAFELADAHRGLSPVTLSLSGVLLNHANGMYKGTAELVAQTMAAEAAGAGKAPVGSEASDGMLSFGSKTVDTTDADGKPTQRNIVVVETLEGQEASVEFLKVRAARAPEGKNLHTAIEAEMATLEA